MSPSGVSLSRLPSLRRKALPKFTPTKPSLSAIACSWRSVRLRGCGQRACTLEWVATSGALDELAETGSLTRALGLPARLRAAGWDAATQAQWLPLLAPLGPPGLDPAAIVMLLGAADDLTPFAGGRALAARWRVPADNLFVEPGRGHFSVAIGLQRDPAPLARLLALLGAG